MILEVAHLEIAAGKETAFEQGYAAARPLFLRAKGCRGVELKRSFEQPQSYRLFVQWETLEDHTITFRNSPDFQEWRRLVQDNFAAPPHVEHLKTVG
jgi:heme-degrading monooxygenase HmoA